MITLNCDVKFNDNDIQQVVRLHAVYRKHCTFHPVFPHPFLRIPDGCLLVAAVGDGCVQVPVTGIRQFKPVSFHIALIF